MTIPPQPPPSWQAPSIPPPSDYRRDTSARRIAGVGVLIGFVGVALAVWSLIMASSGSTNSVAATAAPVSDSPTTYTSEDATRAKSQICEAHALALTAVTNANNPPDPGADVGLRRANAALAQLSLIAGAEYLQKHLDPATPTELRDMVEVLIDKWLLAAVEGIGGGSPTYEQNVGEANTASQEVERLCK